MNLPKPLCNVIKRDIVVADIIKSLCIAFLVALYCYGMQHYINYPNYLKENSSPTFFEYGNEFIAIMSVVVTIVIIICSIVYISIPIIIFIKDYYNNIKNKPVLKCNIKECDEKGDIK